MLMNLHENDQHICVLERLIYIGYIDYVEGKMDSPLVSIQFTKTL